MDKKGSAKALFCPLLHYFHKLFCFCPDTASGYKLFWFSFYRELDQFNLGVPQFCRLYAEFTYFYLLVQLRETLLFGSSGVQSSWWLYGASRFTKLGKKRRADTLHANL